MSKTEGPLFSVSASGTFADTIIYQKNRAGNFARSYFTKKDAQSDAQLDIRWLNKECIYNWGKMTLQQKAAWNSEAAGLSQSGWNIFYAQYIKRRRAGLTAYKTPGVEGGDFVEFIPENFLGAKEQTVTPADSITIDWNYGATALLLLNRATTTITLSNPSNGQVYRLQLLQDNAGNRAVTWITPIKWRDGSPPTLTITGNKIDWITFVYSNNEWSADISLNF